MIALDDESDILEIGLGFCSKLNQSSCLCPSSRSALEINGAIGHEHGLSMNGKLFHQAWGIFAKTLNSMNLQTASSEL